MGAIVGDICGSRFERGGNLTKEIIPIREMLTEASHFTDDTVHTIAIADAILQNPKNPDFKESLLKWSWQYKEAGYGKMFVEWMTEKEPYGSYGNGSAMRISPIGWMNLFHHDIYVAEMVERATIITHNSPEGLKGARAVNLSMGVAISVKSAYEEWKTEWAVALEDFLYHYIGYDDIKTSIANVRPEYTFNATCQGSVPQAIRCFLESNSYEGTIELAVSLGGDTDTQAAIAGSIANVIWDIPEDILLTCYKKLPESMIKVIDNFDTYLNAQV